MIVQFLARVNTSARGLDYYSWAINDHAVEMIRKAKNPRVFVALEVVRGERWEEEGRFFHRDKFLKLMKNFSRRPKGGNGDFATISEFELARFAANPENPERKMWDK